jgi:hypothetical protein
MRATDCAAHLALCLISPVKGVKHFPVFRPEKREVRGSMPRPTTEKSVTRVRPSGATFSVIGNLASQNLEVTAGSAHSTFERYLQAVGPDAGSFQ